MEFKYVQGTPIELCEKMNEEAKVGDVKVIASEYVNGKFLLLYTIDK